MKIKTDIAAKVIEEINKLTGKELGWSAHTDIDTNKAYTKINLRNIDALRYDCRLTLHIIERQMEYDIIWESSIYAPEFKYDLNDDFGHVKYVYCYRDTGNVRVEDIPYILSVHLKGEAYSPKKPKKEKLPYIDPAEVITKCFDELGEELLVEGRNNTFAIRSEDYDHSSYGRIIRASCTDTAIFWLFSGNDESLEGPYVTASGKSTLAWFPSVVKKYMYDDLSELAKEM